MVPGSTDRKIGPRRKRSETRERVLISLKTMQTESIPINFNSVSNFTGVTKAWLYKQEEIKALIKQAKGKTNNLLMQDQAVQIQSKDKAISILTKQNKLLRKQIEELRQQLEVAYAEIYKKEK